MKNANNPDLNLNYVQQYAQRFEQNPDEYFSGSYDWYFTGSNMVTVKTPLHDLLFHVGTPELNVLSKTKKCITKFV